MNQRHAPAHSAGARSLRERRGPAMSGDRACFAKPFGKPFVTPSAKPCVEPFAKSYVAARFVFVHQQIQRIRLNYFEYFYILYFRFN